MSPARVYSWNVLWANRKLPEIFNFVENLDFDVLCLQEVSEEMLVRFKEMPFHITYNVEFFLEAIFSRNKIERATYSVILSRHEISGKGMLEFPKLSHSFRSDTFVLLKAFIQRKLKLINNLGAVYADINMSGTIVRVFSVHLALWNPRTRAEEFACALKHLPEAQPVIMAGDFNIIEYGPMKILNWLFGGSFVEGMPWYSERRLFEERFRKYGLNNPLRGQITHHFSHSQLDHILTSEEFLVKKARVIPERHGSDHQPVFVEVELTT